VISVKASVIVHLAAPVSWWHSAPSATLFFDLNVVGASLKRRASMATLFDSNLPSCESWETHNGFPTTQTIVSENEQE
jgi:hypothetical protein